MMRAMRQNMKIERKTTHPVLHEELYTKPAVVWRHDLPTWRYSVHRVSRQLVNTTLARPSFGLSIPLPASAHRKNVRAEFGEENKKILGARWMLCAVVIVGGPIRLVCHWRKDTNRPSQKGNFTQRRQSFSITHNERHYHLPVTPLTHKAALLTVMNPLSTCCRLDLKVYN